jgi:hypothetical protein
MAMATDMDMVTGMAMAAKTAMVMGMAMENAERTKKRKTLTNVPAMTNEQQSSQ